RDRVIETLAKLTPGFTGADLANLVNEAALLAARRDKTRISMPEFEESIDRVMVGPERKTRVMTEAVRRRTAYHEAARAMVCEFGMSERLGPLRLGKRHGNPFLGRDIMEDRDYSEEVAQAIDEEVRAIIDRNYDRARSILIENRGTLEKISDELMERE